MKKTIVLLILALTIPQLISAETRIRFLSRGKLVKEISLDQLTSKFPSKWVTVLEIHENEKVRYKALPFNKVMDAIYGKAWRKQEDEVLLTCVDGYQPSTPVGKFLSFDSYLAFERSGKTDFTILNKLQGNEIVSLAPLYLIWDNIKSPALIALGGTDWPYQVVSIDLIRADSKFNKMIPPKGSSEKVRRGFAAFRTYCFNCHSVNGDGGKKSIELNFPVSVTEYFKEPWLARWIKNPTGMRPKTTMPAMLAYHKTADSTIADLIEYLKAMAKNKRTASD